MNRLPIIINENSIFYKIKKFFYNLLNSNKKNIQEDIVFSEQEQIRKNNFLEELKREINEQKSRKSIIEKIEQKPEIIYNLPTERLKQLINIYKDEIKKVDMEILQVKTHNNA